jgi:hypothetical protein
LLSAIPAIGSACRRRFGGVVVLVGVVVDFDVVLSELRDSNGSQSRSSSVGRQSMALSSTAALLLLRVRLRGDITLAEGVAKVVVKVVVVDSFSFCGVVDLIVVDTATAATTSSDVAALLSTVVALRDRVVMRGVGTSIRANAT